MFSHNRHQRTTTGAFETPEAAEWPLSTSGKRESVKVPSYMLPGSTGVLPGTLNGDARDLIAVDEERIERGPLALVAQPLPTTLTTDKVATTGLTTTTRQRVVIPAARKKAAIPSHASSRSRHVRPLFVSVGIFLTLFIVFSSLALALPLDRNQENGLGILNPLITLMGGQPNGASEIEGVAATATAVTQSGYDDGQMYPGVSYDGTLPAATAEDAAMLAKFTIGQCTYYANYRYHELTGVWLPWTGHAYMWYAGALNWGWNVSEVPPVGIPSILVMDSYVAGAGYYGHVAIVEAVNGDGTVTISHWNWANNWGTTTYMTIAYPIAGLNYVWI